jgi:hypothetical protein
VRKPDWIKSQLEDAKAEVRQWPQWLRQARGLEESEDAAQQPAKQQAADEAPGQETHE